MKIAKRAEANGTAALHAQDPAHANESFLLQWAKYYRRRGLRVTRAIGKNACDKGWPTKEVGEADLQEWFGDNVGYNVGIVTGSGSGNLVDVDLDCNEALAVVEAFLPATGWIFGRPSRPRSHWLYLADRVDKSLKLFDPLIEKGDDEKAVVIELRSDGHQTVMPPSRHPSGEEIAWDPDFTDPAPATWDVLALGVHQTAIAALLIRYWPPKANGMTSPWPWAAPWPMRAIPKTLPSIFSKSFSGPRATRNLPTGSKPSLVPMRNIRPAKK
jgi:hypothetical protein